MRLKLIILGIVIGFNGFSQTLEELELQLKNTPILQLDSVKNICKKIFEIDKYNESAIYYLIESYRYQLDDSPEELFFTGRDKSQIDTTINYNDSIKYVFDKLIQNDELNPQPYILKAKFQNVKPSLTDSNRIEPLEKAISLDKNNIEANYLLGQTYYYIFQESINKNVENPDLKAIAVKSFNSLEQAFLIDSSLRVSVEYPLIQLANYLEMEDKVEIIENYPISSNLYFPVQLFGEFPDNWRNNYKFNVMSEIDLALFVDNWYSSQLKAMNEPIIYISYESDNVFRFTWLRTFHNPIAIRLENDNGKIFLTWKECDGTGGYESGNLIVDKQKELSIDKWYEFLNLIDNIDFWNQPTIEPEVMGMDGAQWILEGLDGTRYHVIDRWSPSHSDYSKCCMFLLNLTELKIKEKEIY